MRPGLEQWQGAFESNGPLDRLPAVGINASGMDQLPFGAFDWPAGVVRVHQLGSDAVIVAWRSPLAGTAQVDARFSDLHASCGDGIGWFVDREGSTLAGGHIDNGGPSAAVSINVVVRSGETLYFIVTDGGFGDYYCDSTGLTATVSLQPNS